MSSNEKLISQEQVQRASEYILVKLHESHLEVEAAIRTVEDLRASLIECSRGNEQLREDNLRLNKKSDSEKELFRQTCQERDRSRIQLLLIKGEMEALKEKQRNDKSQIDALNYQNELFRQFWLEQQPSNVRIDMRKNIIGTNWYPPEMDGCWTGPEQVSTIEMPALKIGAYELKMTLVGSMNPTISNGMRVHLNDIPLEMDFNRIKHPRTATATFNAPSMGPNQTWILKLWLPAVESPSVHGGNDLRTLGIRVSEINFISIPE